MATEELPELIDDEMYRLTDAKGKLICLTNSGRYALQLLHSNQGSTATVTDDY